MGEGGTCAMVRLDRIELQKIPKCWLRLESAEDHLGTSGQCVYRLRVLRPCPVSSTNLLPVLYNGYILPTHP